MLSFAPCMALRHFQKIMLENARQRTMKVARAADASCRIKFAREKVSIHELFLGILVSKFLFTVSISSGCGVVSRAVKPPTAIFSQPMILTII